MIKYSLEKGCIFLRLKYVKTMICAGQRARVGIIALYYGFVSVGVYVAGFVRRKRLILEKGCIFLRLKYVKTMICAGQRARWFMQKIDFDGTYFNPKDVLECGQVFRFKQYKEQALHSTPLN